MAIRRNREKQAGPARGASDEPVDLVRLVVDEITWYMREHKVSRGELAQAMKVSPGRVSQILSADENLTLRTLAGVFAALRAQVDFGLRPVDERAAALGRESTED
ncbi:MAG: hypothetical protein J2P15_11010 [Micromonosporaceae bacterium]|nr:hypothetical protein [Micromonosporaceae bacterium]